MAVFKILHSRAQIKPRFTTSMLPWLDARGSSIDHDVSCPLRQSNARPAARRRREGELTFWCYTLSLPCLELQFCCPGGGLRYEVWSYARVCHRRLDRYRPPEKTHGGDIPASFAGLLFKHTGRRRAPGITVTLHFAPCKCAGWCWCRVCGVLVVGWRRRCAVELQQQSSSETKYAASLGS